MEKTLVSIIVPIYNGEKYINRCLDSIVSQTLKNIEIIIINDGSTDNTENILKEYIKSDSRIKYIKTSNKGVSNARNIGLKNSSGEYIGFVDIDDYIVSNMYEKLYEKSKKNNADIVFCAHTSIHESCNLYESPCDKELIISTKDDKIKNIYIPFINSQLIYLGMCPTKLYRKKFIYENEIVFDCSRKIGEDAYFNLQIITQAENIIITPESYYFYNKINESSTRRYIENMIDIDITNFYTRKKIYDKWSKDIELNLSNFYCTFIDCIYACCRNEIIENKKDRFSKKVDNMNKIINRKEVSEIIKEISLNLPLKYNKKMEFILKDNNYKYYYLYLYFYSIELIKNILKKSIGILNKINIGIKRNYPFFYKIIES